jgi:hypothetical protein
VKLGEVVFLCVDKLPSDVIMSRRDLIRTEMVLDYKKGTVSMKGIALPLLDDRAQPVPADVTTGEL